MTYLYIVSFVTYITGEILKLFNLNSKYHPIVNIGIGAVSGGICLFTGVLPYATNAQIVEAFATCIIASLGAGGFYDIFNSKSEAIQQGNINKVEKIEAELPEEVDKAPSTHGPEEAIVIDEEGAVG